jgi:cysteine desulfurase family protein (TIGR01976 family)
MAIDVESVRAQFPALKRRVGDHVAAYFDGPAGSQVPTSVIDAVGDCMANHNANTHGQFVTAAETDAVLDEARAACADLVGSSEPDLIAFGANMTSLTFSLSRSLARTWKPGDEVVVTRLDHDANITPWVMAARDAGATMRHIPFRADDTTLDMDAFRSAINERTVLVAIGAASNATGTVNDVGAVAGWARAVGARVFVDAVHFAPHALMDVEAWGCDFLACSAYKFFGPHVGILWGKREALSALEAYQVRAADDALPGPWCTGTQNHEGIAGTRAAIDYIASLAHGEHASRRAALRAAYDAIAAYELPLLERLIAGLESIDGVRVYGITDRDRMMERLPTVSFTRDGHPPAEIARRLGEQGIFVWDGNYYAVDVTADLGVDPDGMVRIGILHYNTADEVDRLIAAVRDL